MVAAELLLLANEGLVCVVVALLSLDDRSGGHCIPRALSHMITQERILALGARPNLQVYENVFTLVVGLVGLLFFSLSVFYFLFSLQFFFFQHDEHNDKRRTTNHDLTTQQHMRPLSYVVPYQVNK